MKNNKSIKLTSDIIPAQATHPGQLLKDEIEYRGIKQKEIAKTTGIALHIISEIIHCKRNITPAIALKLESALDIDTAYWMRLQFKFEIDSIRIKHRDQIANSKLSKKKKDSLSQKVLQHA